MLDDSIGERVRHREYLGEDAVERARVVAPPALKPRGCFLGRESEVLIQHRKHGSLRPVGIRPAQKCCQLVGVGMPATVGVGDLRVVAGLGRAHEIDGDENVLLEQVGQPRAGGGAIIRDDGIADVFLIAE